MSAPELPVSPERKRSEEMAQHKFRSHADSNEIRYVSEEECEWLNDCHVPGCNLPREQHPMVPR